MRWSYWSYLIPRAVVIGLAWAFFHFGFDPAIQRGLVDSGQRTARAKLEIVGLSTTFFAPTLKARNVQVANRNQPGTNLIEFSDLHAKVETRALLRKSFIVDEASLSGLRWGTKRADSGLLSGDEPDPLEDSHNQMLENIEKVMLRRRKHWLAGLLARAQLDFDPKQFETVRLGQELAERWQKEFDRYHAEVDTLKKRIDELRKSAAVKEGNELEKVDRDARAAQEAEQLLHELEQLRQQLDQSIQHAKNNLHALNAAQGHNLRKMKEKVDLLHLDPNEISELLFGPELSHRLEQAIGWAKFIRERIAFATDDPHPEQMRGQTIVFPRQQKLPLLLIRLLNLDGEGDFGSEHLTFKGTISGITSDPKTHGKPIIVRIDGHGGADVQLQAVLDHTRDVPEHQILFSYKEPRPDRQELGTPDTIKLAVASRGVNCLADLKFVGDDLSGQIDFQQAVDSITAKIGDKRFIGDDCVVAVIQDIVSDVRKIDAQMHLSGTMLKPKFQLKSNLGQELSCGVNVAFARQLEAGRREILARFDAETAKQSEELTRRYDEQVQKLTGKLQLHHGEVQEIAQAFGLKMPGKFELKGIAGGLPGGLKDPQDTKSLSQNRPLSDTLSGLENYKKAKPATESIRQANLVERTFEELGLFGRKPKTPAPKQVQPAVGELPDGDGAK